MIYGQLRKYLGQVFKDLARSRESEVIEGHMMPDWMKLCSGMIPTGIKQSDSSVIIDPGDDV